MTHGEPNHFASLFFSTLKWETYLLIGIKEIATHYTGSVRALLQAFNQPLLILNAQCELSGSCLFILQGWNIRYSIVIEWYTIPPGPFIEESA